MNDKPDPSSDPRIKSFFTMAHEQIGKAFHKLSRSPEAKRLTREEECTILACASIRCAALAIAAVRAEDHLDEFEGLLAAEVAKIRAHMRGRGVGATTQ